MDVLYLVIVTAIINKWIDSVDPDKSSMFEILTLTFAVLLHLTAVFGIIGYNLVSVLLTFMGK